jgi:drug/metabolite transporter (DMT)-like permease
VLRADNRHQGMIAAALRDSVIPRSRRADSQLCIIYAIVRPRFVYYGGLSLWPQRKKRIAAARLLAYTWEDSIVGKDRAMHQAPKVMGLSEWGLLIVLSLLWGGSFFFSEVALAELRPFSLVLGRVSLAALALHLLVLATGQRMPASPRLWGQFAAMGLLNNLVPFSLIVWGQTQIASGLASILNATTPLWGVLLAHLLTRDERLTANRLGGVVLGLGGVVVLLGPDALRGLGLNLLAQLAVLGAALAYALAGIFGKRFAGVPPLLTATGQITCSALLLAPLALVVDRPWERPLPGLATWGAVLGIALLSTAVAYVIYFRLLATAGATNLLLVTLLIPASALLLGTTLLGERLDPRQLGGMALIGAGLAAIDGRLPRWLWARLRIPQGAAPTR